MSGWSGLYNYWAVIFLMMTGLYTVISRHNLVKKVIGLTVFQTSVFLLYITMGKVAGGTAPIVAAGEAAYANPLPHALILTAIVVGISTTAVGLALIIRIHQAYGTLEEDEIAALDHPPTDGRPPDDSPPDRNCSATSRSC